MSNIILGAHQLEALNKLKNGNILCGGTGSGKSRTAIAYFFLRVGNGKLRINGEGDLHPLQTPTDLYIITTKKKRDDREWEGELANFALSKDVESSISPIKITIDSWNNIGKYQEVANAFFIFDEQRLVGRGAWVRAFLRIAKANRWVLLSATPGDSWIDYVPVFIANGFYRNRTEFNARHVVFSRYSKFPKVERFLDTDLLHRHRRSLLVDMPYERHTTRKINLVYNEFDRSSWDMVFKKRWNIFEDRPIKDVAELFRCMRQVVNGDVSRIGSLMEILEKHPRLIIFYNFNYELAILRTLGETLNYTYAEWNGTNHDPVPTTDKWMYLVQYTAGSEGWNCVSTDAMVFYSLTYSYKQFEQAQGRIDRMNTRYRLLNYYVFTSNSVIDKRIWDSLRSKKNFQERKNEDLWPKTQN